MLYNKYREKLLHALLYFAKNVKYPYKTNLIKLVWHFDREHMRVAGRSVTNLEYVAMENGPVPQSFYDEMSGYTLPPDFLEFIDVELQEGRNPQRPQMLFHPKVEANLKLFSPRQQEILKTLAQKYKNSTSRELCDSTHEAGGPWDNAYEEGYVNDIDIVDAVENDEKKSEAYRMLESRKAITKSFGIRKSL